MTPEYQIKIYYKTGDSFGSRDAEDLIDYEWKNLKSAQQSIVHIKNHYEYFLEKNYEWEKPKGKLPDGIGWSNQHRILMLMLIDDDGKTFKYSPFWSGYHDKLHYAEIIIKESSLGSYRPPY